MEYVRQPIAHIESIPVFSAHSDYTDNYDAVSRDHLLSQSEKGENPWIPELLWQELETSTLGLIRKYARPGDRILDVGVGLGRLLSHLPDLERYGTDISVPYLQVAEARGIDVCYAMVEDLPYADEMFDHIVCTDVLEHVIDLNGACLQMLRTLRRGGTLIVRVPYRENLRPYVQPDYPYRFAHLRNFDEYSLQLLFERIVGAEFVEWVTAGWLADSGRLQWGTSWLPFDIAVTKVVRQSGFVSQGLSHHLTRRLFTPIEINVVVRKHVRSAA